MITMIIRTALIINFVLAFLCFNKDVDEKDKLFVVIPINTDSYAGDDLNEINNSLISKLQNKNRKNFVYSHSILKQLNKFNKSLYEIMKDSILVKKLGEELKVRFIIISFITRIDQRIALSITITDILKGDQKHIAADKDNCTIKEFNNEIIPKVVDQIIAYCK